MDRVIGSYPCVLDEDLNFCIDVEIAYQNDMSNRIDYGKDYFENYIHLEGTTIADALNEARVGIVEKYCQGADTLDIGIGSGEFIKSSQNEVYGFDINPYGQEWLKEKYLYVDPWENIPANIKGVSLWDTLEHMEEPTKFLDLMPPEMYVFVSMPMVKNIRDIKESKHYKPNEHYYYFTTNGFASYSKDAGYEVLEQNNVESQAGREDVHSFVLKKL